MALRILKKIFGTANDRLVGTLRKEVVIINKLESAITLLDDSQLRNKTYEFKEMLSNGKHLDDIMHEAFAVVREAAKRVLGQRHFDEQLIGGLALHRGMISEMRTGEGKTLVATAPAYLNALSGKGVHIVTTNDYLGKRDAEWMGPVFEFLGLSVGCITSNLSALERQKAYNSDITYSTNNELGFDYLRDNMKYDIHERVLRNLHYAIIDEVDSILIDEARTPLIISGAVEQNSHFYRDIDAIVQKLNKEDYEQDEKSKSVHLSEAGINHVELLLRSAGMIGEQGSLFDFDNMKLVHYITQALKAYVLFKNNVNYIVKDGKVVIIDEFTGRTMIGRRYSDGLHQALEAKEKVNIENENQTLASITFQNYFRMYDKLSGMTGTAMTEAAELKDIYNLDVLSVPPHRKVIRVDHHDEIYGSAEEKYAAILETVIEKHAKGQPILIGTVSIEKSEDISRLLTNAKINHNVLNAKQHEREAYIIAQAGKFGAVTIATNMAGRGTDIMLGGNPEMLAKQIQIDVVNEPYKFIEIQKSVADEKTRVLDVGGLYVLGTERHESRRIDDQLRGRTARQGDPGETKFYLSLDDDLMRIFASDKISGLLRKLGLKNGEAIVHPMINRAIAGAQHKVESHHYEVRKNLLKYDNVMNEQRHLIYDQRDTFIKSTDLSEYFTHTLSDWVISTVELYVPKDSFRELWKLDNLAHVCKKVLNITLDLEQIANQDTTDAEIIDDIIQTCSTLYLSKEKQYGKEHMCQMAKYTVLRILDQLWKNHLYIMDQLKHGIHLRAYGQKDPLNEYKRESFILFEKMIDQLKELFLHNITKFCTDSDTNEAKPEQTSLQSIQATDVHETRSDDYDDENVQRGESEFAQYHKGVIMTTKLAQSQHTIEPTHRDPNDQSTWGKVRRNESCPCNSGKKYKICHGAFK